MSSNCSCSNEKVAAVTATSMLYIGKASVRVTTDTVLAIMRSEGTIPQSTVLRKSTEQQQRQNYWLKCGSCNQIDNFTMMERDQVETAVLACKKVFSYFKVSSKKSIGVAEDAAFKVLSGSVLYKEILKKCTSDNNIDSIADAIASTFIKECRSRANSTQSILCYESKYDMKDDSMSDCSILEEEESKEGHFAISSNYAKTSYYPLLCLESYEEEEEEEDKLHYIASTAFIATQLIILYQKPISTKFVETIAKFIFLTLLEKLGFIHDPNDYNSWYTGSQALQVSTEAASELIYYISVGSYTVSPYEVEQHIVKTLSGNVFYDENDEEYYYLENKDMCNIFQILSEKSDNFCKVTMKSDDLSKISTSSNERNEDFTKIPRRDTTVSCEVISRNSEEKKVFINNVVHHHYDENSTPASCAKVLEYHSPFPANENEEVPLRNDSYSSTDEDSSFDSFNSFEGSTCYSSSKTISSVENAIEALQDVSNQTILLIQPKPFDYATPDCIDVAVGSNKQVIIFASSDPCGVVLPKEKSKKNNSTNGNFKTKFKVFRRFDEFEILKISN